MREAIIVNFIVLLALDHRRLEPSLDTVAEFGAFTRTQVTVGLALSLLEVVRSRGQDLGRHVCLLNDPL